MVSASSAIIYATCLPHDRWKLLISPTEPSAAMKDQMATGLPKGKSIVNVFADFMGYLFESTKALFKATEPNGDVRWDSVSNSIELILTHPNGWEGPQQAQLRTAAIEAGIVPDTPVGRSSVRFVTEGEASFNFCATNTQAGKDLEVCRGPNAIQSWLFDAFIARRASLDHRCRRRDH